MYGDPEEHSSVRGVVCEVMSASPDFFAPFGRGDIIS
jgi:hypothetical protein